MITVEQGRSVMQPRINSQTRHEHYDRTVNRRKLYHAMMTGDDIESYLSRFESRESTEQFELRKKITQQCVSPAINEAAAKFYKTSRYPNIKKEMKYEGSAGSGRLDKLQDALKKFCYDGDVQGYLATEYDRRSLIDPNGFLVIDFTDFDALQNEKPGAYGVFIPCDNVVDFEFLPNDELNWLLIERPVQIFDSKSNLVNLKDYIGYLGDDILIYEEVHEDRKVKLRQGGQTITAGASEFYEYTLQSKAGQVQAFRLGYIKDPITEYKTVVSALDNAETVVMDLNNDKSEYDQTKRFHVFPQKFVFAPKCPGESDIITCNHGQTHDGHTCKKCSGTGLLIHESSADVLIFPMPKDVQDYVVPLSEMSHYAKPDIEIIKHLREDLDASKLNIMRAIFTTESAVKTDGKINVEQTATEFSIKSDDENNTLLPFCEHKSKVYKFIVRQVANFNDLGEGLKVLFEFPQALRLETVEQLQEKFSLLVKAGASPTLLDDIETEIAAKRFIDDPEGLKKYNTWKQHRPFRNRTREEVEFAMGQGSVPKWLEVLWALFEYIMTEVENTNSGFYDKDYEAQRDLIKAAAMELKNELDPEEPARFLDQGVPAGQAD